MRTQILVAGKVYESVDFRPAALDGISEHVNRLQGLDDDGSTLPLENNRQCVTGYTIVRNVADQEIRRCLGALFPSIEGSLSREDLIYAGKQLQSLQRAIEVKS